MVLVTFIVEMGLYGELAHLGEHLICIQEVIGSSPIFSTHTILLYNIGCSADLEGGTASHHTLSQIE